MPSWKPLPLVTDEAVIDRVCQIAWGLHSPHPHHRVQVYDGKFTWLLIAHVFIDDVAYTTVQVNSDYFEAEPYVLFNTPEVTTVVEDFMTAAVFRRVR